MRGYLIAGAPASPKYPNKLGTNASLRVGGTLSSPNGRGHLTLQSDGNLVFTDMQTNKVLWASGTPGKPVATLKILWNGDLQLLDAKGVRLWGTGDKKQKNCFLEVQDDGNVVVYHDKKSSGTAVWSTGTFLWKQGSTAGKEGATYHQPGISINLTELASVAIGLPPGAFTALKAVSPSAGKWAENAVKTAGAEAHSALHAISKATADLSLAASKVAFIGPLLSGLVDVAIGGPWHMADDVASGVRLDKAISRELKRQLKEFKEIGPYAQMVFSLVPGFGPFIAGAIGAGLALANGQPLDQVFLAGVAGMLPGGPLVQTAAKMAITCVRMATSPGGFKNFSDIGKLAAGVVDALPIPGVAKDLCKGAINICAQLASGARIDQALLDGAVAALPLEDLPPEAANAIVQAKDAIKQIAKGQKVDQVLINTGLKALPLQSLGLPVQATEALRQVIGFGAKVADGQNVEKAAFDSAIKALPIQTLPKSTQQAIAHVGAIVETMALQKKTAQTVASVGMAHARDKGMISKEMYNGMMTGCALGHGGGLQDGLQQSINSGGMIPKLQAASTKVVAKSVIAQAGISALGPATVSAHGDFGFGEDPAPATGTAAPNADTQIGAQIGLGLMAHQDVGLAALDMVRTKLTGDQRKGFDMGVSLHVGLVTMPPAPDSVPPNQAAGTVITNGMLGATTSQVTGMMATLSTHPEMKQGAAIALAGVAEAKEGFWAWIVRIMSGGPHPVTTAVPAAPVAK